MGLTDCIGRSASPTGLLIFRGIGLSEYLLLAARWSRERQSCDRDKPGRQATQVG